MTRRVARLRLLYGASGLAAVLALATPGACASPHGAIKPSASNGKEAAQSLVHIPGPIILQRSPTADGQFAQKLTLPRTGDYQLNYEIKTSSSDPNQAWDAAYRIMLDLTMLHMGACTDATGKESEGSVSFYASAGAHILRLVTTGPESTTIIFSNASLIPLSSLPPTYIAFVSPPQSVGLGGSIPVTLELENSRHLPVTMPHVQKFALIAQSKPANSMGVIESAPSIVFPKNTSRITVSYKPERMGVQRLSIRGINIHGDWQWLDVEKNQGFIHASNLGLLAPNNQPIRLHGVNLGSWLVMEPWMCPMNNDSSLPDEFAALAELDSRFGEARQEQLVRDYQNAWVTPADLDKIHAAGLNCVRIPVWWGDFYTMEGKWRPDAFDQLDKCVAALRARDMYAILDLHGAFGGQSADVVTGEGNINEYWSSPFDQGKTAELWTKIAEHFRATPQIAGYDLLNEPQGAPTQAALWAAYDQLYRAIRAVDPNHLLLMEPAWRGQTTSGGWVNWDWNVLPPPAQFSWSNVAYAPHSYPYTIGAAASETVKQVNEFQQYSVSDHWNIPVIIDEFNEGASETDWSNAIDHWNQAGMNWLFWAYKSTSGTGSNRWGMYNVNGKDGPPSYNGPMSVGKPSLAYDSFASIAANWSRWSTSRCFHQNPVIIEALKGFLR